MKSIWDMKNPDMQGVSRTSGLLFRRKEFLYFLLIEESFDALFRSLFKFFVINLDSGNLAIVR